MNKNYISNGDWKCQVCQFLCISGPIKFGETELLLHEFTTKIFNSSKQKQNLSTSRKKWNITYDVKYTCVLSKVYHLTGF